MIKSLIAGMLVCSTALASPMWTFQPTMPVSVSMTRQDVNIFQYLVTNHAKQKSLVMNSIPGMAQVTTAGNCGNPFSLNTGQSCYLTLQAIGANMVGNVLGGPVVCAYGNPNQCYQPAAGNTLDVKLVG